MKSFRFLGCILLLLSAGRLMAATQPSVTMFENFNTNPTSGWTAINGACKFIWMQDNASTGHMYVYYTRGDSLAVGDRFVKPLSSPISIGGNGEVADPNTKVYLEMDGMVVGGINVTGTGNVGLGRADSNNSTQVLWHRFFWGNPEKVSMVSGFASRLSSGSSSYWHTRTIGQVPEPRAVRYKAVYSYKKDDPNELRPVIDCNSYVYEINDDGSTGALIGANRVRQDPNDVNDVNTITVNVMGIFNQYASISGASFIEAYVDNLYVSTTGFNANPPVKPSWFNPSTTFTKVIPTGQTNVKDYLVASEGFDNDPTTRSDSTKWTAVYGNGGYTGKTSFTWKSYLTGGYLDAKLVREGGETNGDGSYWTTAPTSSARYYYALGKTFYVRMYGSSTVSPITWFMQYDAYMLDVEPESEAIIGGGDTDTVTGSYRCDLIGTYFNGGQDAGEGIRAFVGGYDYWSNYADYENGEIDFDPNNNEQVADGLLSGHSYRFKFYTGASRGKPRIIGLVYDINDDGSDGRLISFKTSTVGYGYNGTITPAGFQTDSIGLYTSGRLTGNPIDRIHHILVDNIYFSTLGFRRVNIKPSWMEIPDCSSTTQYLDTDLGNASGLGSGYYDCEVNIADLYGIAYNWLVQGN